MLAIGLPQPLPETNLDLLRCLAWMSPPKVLEHDLAATLGELKGEVEPLGNRVHPRMVPHLDNSVTAGTTRQGLTAW